MSVLEEGEIPGLEILMRSIVVERSMSATEEIFKELVVRLCSIANGIILLVDP